MFLFNLLYVLDLFFPECWQSTLFQIFFFLYGVGFLLVSENFFENVRPFIPRLRGFLLLLLLFVCFCFVLFLCVCVTKPLLKRELTSNLTGIAQLVKRRPRNRKFASSNLRGNGVRNFSSRVNLCADSYSVSVPPPCYRRGT